MRGSGEWKPGKLIEYINHFLDRGYVVSLLMDLCHCSVNHSTHNQTWCYLEAGLQCRQRKIEDIIMLLSTLFSSFPPISSFWSYIGLQNKQYLGYCLRPPLCKRTLTHLLALICNAEQSHQKFIPGQAAIMA